MLQCAKDGQARNQNDEAAHDGHGAQHGIANGQALGQRVGQGQQAAGVAEGRSQGQHAQQQQADPAQCGQQHANLLQPR